VTEPSKTARSVGEILRHAREDRNLTLDQVSKAIHIRARFLEALEASDIRALPSWHSHAVFYVCMPNTWS